MYPHGLRRTPPAEDHAGSAPAEGPEGAGARLRELRDRLELELLQQGEEQCECVLRCRAQQVAEVPASGRGGSEGPTDPTPSAQPRASPRS